MVTMSVLLVMAAAVVELVPPTVYARPGATLAQVEGDLRRCRLIATGPATGGERPDGAALLDNGAPGIGPAPTIEGCMATYGWQSLTLSERERRRLARLSPTARRKALERIVGQRR